MTNRKKKIIFFGIILIYLITISIYNLFIHIIGLKEIINNFGLLFGLKVFFSINKEFTYKLIFKIPFFYEFYILIENVFFWYYNNIYIFIYNNFLIIIFKYVIKVYNFIIFNLNLVILIFILVYIIFNIKKF